MLLLCDEIPYLLSIDVLCGPMLVHGVIDGGIYSREIRHDHEIVGGREPFVLIDDAQTDAPFPGELIFVPQGEGVERYGIGSIAGERAAVHRLAIDCGMQRTRRTT